MLLIFIGIGVLFVIAESVNEYQKNPPPEGGLGALILGGVMGMAIGAGTILVPAYVGEWFFGIGGWFVGFVFGIIAWLKLNSYLTGVADGSIEYDLEARIIAYRKGQNPLTFSNTTMALVLYGGLFYLGISQFPGTGILPAAVGGFLGLIIARLIVFKFNKTVLGWMEAEAAKKTEETDEAPDQSIGTLPAMATVTEFGLEGVTFAEGRIDPGPFRKLFMISENRRVSNGVVIIYIVIFLSFMTSLGATGFFVDYSSLSILEFSMFMLVFVPVMFLVYYIPVYLQDWAMDKKFGTSFRHFWKDEEE